MSRLLVVVEPHESTNELLDVATEFVSGTDHELVLFSVTPEDAGEETRTRMREFTESDTRYELSVEGNAAFARDVGSQRLPSAVSFEADGGIGDPFGRIRGAIDEYDCRHVFVTGRKRTPTGKALFGDTTQELLLNAECPVTLIMR
ncbi:MAG: universal stress protein [Haloplanus sp.]